MPALNYSWGKIVISENIKMKIQQKKERNKNNEGWSLIRMEPVKKLKIKNLKNKNKKTKNDKKMNDTHRSLRQELIFLFNSIHCFVPIIQIFISKKFIVYEIPLPPAVMK